MESAVTGYSGLMARLAATGRRARWLGATLALLLAAPLAPVAAQARGDDGARRTPPTAAERTEYERRFHERLSAIVQRELKLNADQTQRLSDATRRFEQERRPLFQREVELRRALRQDLAEGATPNQQRVDATLREMLQLQRRRLDLLEAEQRELARFLTPVQRAKYHAIQENVRTRVDRQRGRPDGPARARPAEGSEHRGRP